MTTLLWGNTRLNPKDKTHITSQTTMQATTHSSQPIPISEQLCEAIHREPRAFAMKHAMTIGADKGNVLHPGFRSLSQVFHGNRVVSFDEILPDRSVATVEVELAGL